MDTDRIDYERQVLAEIEIESRSCCPVYRSISYVPFVSHSKGRGRKRQHPLEVVLIGYHGKYWTEENFPYDTISTEIYGYSDDMVADRLYREIPSLAAR